MRPMFHSSLEFCEVKGEHGYKDTRVKNTATTYGIEGDHSSDAQVRELQPIKSEIQETKHAARETYKEGFGDDRKGLEGGLGRVSRD